MSRRTLVRHPYVMRIYVCLGCGEQSWPGRDGLGRCQHTDRCGKYVKVEVRPSDEGMGGHLHRAHREWEEILHERLSRVDDRVAAAASNPDGEA